jgi:hypothetical protein
VREEGGEKAGAVARGGEFPHRGRGIVGRVQGDGLPGQRRREMDRGARRYRDLACLGPYGFSIPKSKCFGRDQMQNHALLRQEHATGHAVRAVYLYSALADEYAETCASIGLAFWASRMTEIEGDSRYAEVLERVVECRQNHEHVRSAKVQWSGCACAPRRGPAILGRARSRCSWIPRGRSSSPSG